MRWEEKKKEKKLFTRSDKSNILTTTKNVTMSGCSQLHEDEKYETKVGDVVTAYSGVLYHGIVPERRTSGDEDCDDRAEVELEVCREQF